VDPRALQSKRSPAPLPTNNLAMVPRTVEVVGENGKKYPVTMDVSPRLIVVPRQSIADVYRQK
jgi:hypothetical protein